MITNYLKTAIRNLVGNKSYSLINIGGLTLGMTVCILILTYVFHELSYDKFHKKADQIYRIGVNAKIGKTHMILAMSSSLMGETLRKDFPEVIASTRFSKLATKRLISVDEKKFYQKNIAFADSSFFSVFNFKLLRGNKDEVLGKNKSAVLTESLAKKYFGNHDPMGKTIRLNDQVTYTVSGIIEDVPANSHIQFEIIFSMDLRDPNSVFSRNNNWGSIALYNYVLLDKNTDPKALEAKFPDFNDRHMADLKKINVFFDLFLQPLKKIYLYSDLEGELDATGDIDYVYLFSAIAIFILIIACINYMNLATARSFKRAKEVGMRKIHGAYTNHIIRQFLGESLLFSFIALILSMAIVQIILPNFNDLIYPNLKNKPEDNLSFILMLFVGVTFIVGIIAGSYPAFYMSRFSPIAALKGDKVKGRKKSVLRNILVVLQFSIAVVLMISTIVIYKQLDFINSKDLGFDKENKIVIPIRQNNFRKKIASFKNEFKNLSFVENVTISTGVPSLGLNGSGFIPEGSDTETPMIIYNSIVDQDFLNTYSIEVKEGRNFSSDYGTDSLNVLVNEKLCKVLGWDQAIGKTLGQPVGENEEDTKLKVIGVVKDFHFRSLMTKVEPFMFLYHPKRGSFISINIKAGNFEDGLQQVKNKWAELSNNLPLDYFILKESYEQQYISYIRMGKLFSAFTIIAIFVACIGLFGLSSFLTELRTKEIGIRKVQGASVITILRLLNRDFLIWVFIANVIAWPFAFYFMSEWLNNFSYQIELQWYYFALGLLFSVFIAMITVSYQTVKTATRNPVESLRYE